jgi:hypothetical protein
LTEALLTEATGESSRLSAARLAQRSTAVSLADADAVPQLGCLGIGQRGLITLSPAA